MRERVYFNCQGCNALMIERVNIFRENRLFCPKCGCLTIVPPTPILYRLWWVAKKLALVVWVPLIILLWLSCWDIVLIFGLPYVLVPAAIRVYKKIIKKA